MSTSLGGSCEYTPSEGEREASVLGRSRTHHDGVLQVVLAPATLQDLVRPCARWTARYVRFGAREWLRPLAADLAARLGGHRPEALGDTP